MAKTAIPKIGYFLDWKCRSPDFRARISWKLGISYPVIRGQYWKKGSFIDG